MMNYDKYLSTHFARVGNARESRMRLESLRANYSRLLPTDREAAILEIGPGRGEFLELTVAEMGYRRVAAIDLSLEVAEHLARRFPGVVHAATTSDYLVAHPASYEAIFMMHVLEHVPKIETIALLGLLRSALAPGGVLVIEVPNMANPIVGLTFRYGDFTHESGFTRGSLEQVLRMAGFEDVSVRPFVIPRTSLARFAQWFGRFLIEGTVSLIGLLYFGRREIVSPNVVAVARTRARLTS